MSALRAPCAKRTRGERTPPHPPPATDQARLAEGEGQENAYGVKGDQAGNGRLVDPDQHRSREGQDDDAAGEGQAVAAEGELTWEEVVVGEDGGQAGEAVEGGIGCQEQQNGSGELEEVVEPALASKEGFGQQAEDSLDLVG